MSTKALKRMWRQWADVAGDIRISLKAWARLMAADWDGAQPEEQAAAIWLGRKS